MAVIAPNLNDRKMHPPNKPKLNNITYGYKESFERTSDYSGRLKKNSYTNLINTQRVPLRADKIRKNIAFKGNFSFTFKELSEMFNPKKAHVADLFYGNGEFAGIVHFFNPKESLLSRTMEHGLKKHKLHEVGKNEDNARIRVKKSFWESARESVTDLPKSIEDKVKSFLDKDYKKELKEKEALKKVKSEILGLWMNIDKIARDFDETIKSSHGELKGILENGHKGKETELSAFFEKNELGHLFSHKDGKSKGILAEKDHLAEFTKEISADSIKDDDNSVLEMLKKAHVKKKINGTMVSKEGAYLPTYSQTQAQAVARVVSGIIPAYFIANDFYNLRITNSDNESQAKKEWKSKFGQETFRIGINTYVGTILGNMFERLVNKSLGVAVGINIFNAIISNILSRKLTKRPVLPVGIDKAVQLNQRALKLADAKNNEKETESANSSSSNNTENLGGQQKKLEVYKAFKGNNKDVSFGSNNQGLMHRLKNMLVHEKMSFNEFKGFHKSISKIHEDDANKMMEIAAEHMLGKDYDRTKPHDLLLQKLQKEAEKNEGKIIIGKKNTYKIAKNLAAFLYYPIEIVLDAGKLLLNQGIKLYKKVFKNSDIKPFDLSVKKEFESEQFIKNVTMRMTKAEREAAKFSVEEKVDLEKAKELIYGERKKSFFSTKVMNYGTDSLSTLTKLTGLVSVPFLAVDAYNVTLGETRNKDVSKDKMRERSVQDTTRQGVSFWYAKTFNNIFKVVSNHSLPGSALVTGLQTVAYESTTRLLIGQPLKPTTHEKMMEIEKARASKKKNWFVKVMSGKIKTASNYNYVEHAAKETKQDNTPSQKVQMNNISFNELNVHDLYKKFSTNSMN